ncbi:MAG: hypothetical protein CMJ33_03700 [Phycisphaerae bacterium]|nr:hypothetical protein [Phycisphaerae bacterium]HAW95213.1 hypothetical protein [Phycisphaerales bacterium]|tara:strand:+ start:76 stop:624 length:549 start_codon:yes stop_codon:yes gene_type:complete
MTSMLEAQKIMKHRNSDHRRFRTGGTGGPIILILLFIIVAAMFLILWGADEDGRAGQRAIDESSPAGTVEGNMAQQANWTAAPIVNFISKNDRLPDEAEGAKLLQSLSGMTEPKYFPPTPAEGGNPSYRKTNDGFEIVFTMPEAKDVVCRFSAAGVYEGATGLGAFTEEDDAMEDSLKDPLR